jgi:hypothetical protein
MAVLPTVGPWPLFKFVDPIQSLWDYPSQGRYIHTGQHKHRIITSIQASSGIRTHDLIERAKTVHALDTSATVIASNIIY